MRTNKNRAYLYITIAAVIGFGYGIAFVNNWLVLNKYYPKIRMFNIPFDPTVWGTVSDWIMVIVSALTILLIWKTFSAQLQTLNEQIELTRIEKSRFLSEILPKPKIESQLISSNSGQLRISFENNIGYQVIIKNVSDAEFQFKSIKVGMSILAPSFSTEMPMIENYVFNKDLDVEKLSIKFDVYFTDKIGTKYYQEFAGKAPMNLLSRAPVQQDYLYSE